MKVTAILKNLSDQFYDGNGGSIAPFSGMAVADKYACLVKLSRDLPKSITFKIGNGSFRDRVDFNGMLRGCCAVSFKIEPRKGYKLATFEFTPATGPDDTDYYPGQWVQS